MTCPPPTRATLALLVVLAGCAAGPDRGTALSLPEPPPALAAAAEPSAEAPDWRQAFPDPALQALVEQALAGNRDLRVAAARVAEARGAWGLRQADAGPTLAAELRSLRYGIPAAVSPFGTDTTGGVQQAGLALASWEIDLFGRLRAQSDAARERWLASEAGRRALALQLVAQVADGWYALCALDERLALARATQASRADSLRITRRRVEVGAAARLTLLQVQTLATQADSLVARLEQERAAQLEALALLVGARPRLPAALPRLAELAAGAPLAPGLPATLLERRPDLVAAEHELAAARADVAAARAAFFPQITLTALAGSASAELDGLFDAGTRQWIATPALTLPLWDGGLRARNLDVNEARRDAAVARYEKAVQSAFRDVADALAAQRWLDEQLRIAGVASAAQTERARLARLRQETGATSFLEVLDAERDRLAAEQALVQARRAALGARVALFAALGGGAPTLPAR